MTWPLFDQVDDPYSQPCPDCTAAVGERCENPHGPTMVHIRRFYTPESNDSIERYYAAERNKP